MIAHDLLPTTQGLLSLNGWPTRFVDYMVLSLNISNVGLIRFDGFNNNCAGSSGYVPIYFWACVGSPTSCSNACRRRLTTFVCGSCGQISVLVESITTHSATSGTFRSFCFFFNKVFVWPMILVHLRCAKCLSPIEDCYICTSIDYSTRSQSGFNKRACEQGSGFYLPRSMTFYDQNNNLPSQNLGTEATVVPHWIDYFQSSLTTPMSHYKMR